MSNRTNALVMGPIQTGKTWSTRTLLPEYPDINGKICKGAGKVVCTVSLEPGWEDTNGDVTCGMGMHMVYIPPLDVEWADLEAMTKLVNAATDVTKVNDPNRRYYTQLLDTYSALKKFVCQRCGQEFGDCAKLDEHHAVVMDGLTGLSRSAMTATVGLKPAKTWPEFDAAGQQVENLLRKCASIDATFVLIAHVDREPDKETQKTKLTMHTIGNKLAPRLTKDIFSEIILARRDDRGNFWWSTSEPDMDLKARRLPFNDKITPDFHQILAD
jgi:hypothetical protein